MESFRFDILTRTLAGARSRRGLVRLLASLAAGLLAPVGRGEARRKRAQGKPGKGRLGADKGGKGQSC